MPTDRHRNFGFLLKDVGRLYARCFERHARELELTLAECKVLAHLARNQGASQARLAELADTDPMALVRILDRMQEADWVERRPDPADRRAHCLYLRDAARPVLQRMWQISDVARSQALEMLSGAERDKLVGLLERVHETLLALETRGRG